MEVKDIRRLLWGKEELLVRKGASQVPRAITAAQNKRVRPKLLGTLDHAFDKHEHERYRKLTLAEAHKNARESRELYLINRAKQNERHPIIANEETYKD